LADERALNTAEVGLDMNNGWSASEIIGHRNFLGIMQQGLSYIISGSEVMFNQVIYFFVHNGILHVAEVEIQLTSLEFLAHPNERGVKVVSLEKRTRRTRTVTEDGDKNEEKIITEKILPVKFKAYPLETVTEEGKVKSKVPLHSGMLALTSSIQKMTPILKDASKMKKIRVEMMAIRAEMTLGIPLDTIREAGAKSQRGDEAEDEDEDDHDSKLTGDGVKKKKAKLSSKDVQQGGGKDEKQRANPPQQQENENARSAGIMSDSGSCSREIASASSNATTVFSAKGTSITSSESLIMEMGKNRSLQLGPLSLSFRTENEGPLDYVTNTITLFGSEKTQDICTSMRAFTLETRFGVKLLTPSPLFQHSRQFANVLFMPKSALLERINKLWVESGVNHHRSTLLNLLDASKTWRFEQVAFKYYSLDNLYRLFAEEAYEGGELEMTPDDFSEWKDTVYSDYHDFEWQCLKSIEKHNEDFDQSGDCSDTVAIPKALFKGERLELKLGRWGDCEDMEFFMVTEVLIPENGGWENCLPLSDEVVKDACQQIETMIKKIHIRHKDLKLSNLVFTKGRVHFIDFNIGADLANVGESALEEMVKKDQEIMRSLLLAPR
jgi:hypothetical protein